MVGCISWRFALDIVRELVGIGFVDEGCGCLEEGEGIGMWWRFGVVREEVADR